MEIDGFLRIEHKYNLYHLDVDGVQPWMYYRFKFWNYQICKDLLSLSNTLQKKSKLHRLGKQLKSALRIILNSNIRQTHKADIIFYAHPRRIKTDSYYECIYTDCLLDRYPQSIVFEEPFQNQHLTPVKASHIYYTDLFQIRAALYSRIQRHLKTPKYQRIYTQIQKAFEEPLKEIGFTYGVPVSCDKTCADLTEIVLEIRILRKELKKVFEKIQPRLIVEVVYYNKRCMILNELAKEKGIPTIELQHGTMHAAHAAYQFPDGCGVISQFPDYVFVFSEYWKKCAHLPIADERIKVTGYPYFERQLNQYRKDSCETNGVKNIIFVSQGTIGGELSCLASELCDLLDETKYHIIYKLHPGEYVGWRDRNTNLLKRNIEVIDSLEHNIYEFFSMCSIQVGVYSTAIYEGLGFGLTTYIYDIGHADTLAELCQQGYAVYVRNAEELYAHIIADETNPKDCGNAFWKMNALENICEEIEHLLIEGTDNENTDSDSRQRRI